MDSLSRQWLCAVLLSLCASASGMEPQSSLVAPASETSASVPAPRALLAQAFDLRSANVRQVVRAAVSSQTSYEHHIEPSKPGREKADVAAALRQEQPEVRKPAVPRLPEYTAPPSCDGFFSCGVEALLGPDDERDQELYDRQLRNRLFNQGSFTQAHDNDAGAAVSRSPL